METKSVEEYIEIVRKIGSALRNVPKEVKIKYPEICMEAVKQDGYALGYVPEEVKMKHPEICIEALKNNIQLYLNIDNYVRKNEKIKEFMFEDEERLNKIKEKANFELSKDYNKDQMDIFYHQMIKSIGMDEVEKLIEIPNLSKEEIERYNLEYDEKINELFERTYEIEGKIKATKEILEMVNMIK